MDLSLATKTTHKEQEQEQEQEHPSIITIQKEHMFDKAVTPSDVGKLNRLVIPKQHAEKYFPLDSSANEKGLLLNFEDRNGKAWRFRYSYWNSSQSYVMTKGWSRFVKEKKLDAGDILSFQRGVGEYFRDRLFIDWRRKPNVPDPPSSGIFPTFYSFYKSVSVTRSFEQFHLLNHGVCSYNDRHHCYKPQERGILGYGGMVGRCHVRSSEQISVVADPQAIYSLPVVRGRVQGGVPAPTAAGKRLRLFGVNMECGGSTDISAEEEPSSSKSVLRGKMGSFHSSCSLQLSLPTGEDSWTMQADDHRLMSKKTKSSPSLDSDQL